MELKDRKKDLGMKFKQEMRRLDFTSAKKIKILKSGVELSFDDGTNADMAYATVKRNYPKGEFGLYSLVSISNGPVYQIMCQTHLDKGSSFSGEGILAGTSHNLIDEGHYPVTSDVKIEDVARRVVCDMEKVYVPIITAFTVGYKSAIDFLIHHQGRFVRNPFCMGVILMGLAGSFERLDELVKLAEKHSSYYDFHAAENYRVQIIDPILSWFKKDNGNTS